MKIGELSGKMKTKADTPHQRSDPWRWAVAFGACLVMFCIMSLFRSYGVIYVAILHTYDLTRQEASWPYTLCCGILNSTAFIPGILSSFMSNRQIVFLGSVSGSFGVIFCFFATDLSWIIIFFGIFYGVGMGITIPPLLVLLNKYFTKYRATACGICFTGAALSSIIIPPVTEWLLTEYGLRGTFLLLGGLVLNALVGTALLREDEPVATGLCHECFVIRQHQQTEDETETIITSCVTKCRPYGCCKTVTDNDISKGELRFVCQSDDDGSNLTESSQLRQLNRELVTSKDQGKFSKMSKKIKVGLQDYLAIVRYLMTDGIFCVTTISSTCGWMAYFTFSMIIVDYGLDNQMDQIGAVMLVSIYSTTEIVGRLCTGWLSDTGMMRRVNIMWFTSITSGLVLLGFPFCRSAFALNLLTGLYGLLVGCFIILYSVILADYLGVQKLAVATSLMFFFGGTLTLLRPLLVGYFRDSMGHYNTLFYILGGISLVGGAVWFMEPITRNQWRTRKT